jgi:hypothetical protein
MNERWVWLLRYAVVIVLAVVLAAARATGRDVFRPRTRDGSSLKASLCPSPL